MNSEPSQPALVKDVRKEPLRSEGCSMRVWDNGDMDDCGKPVIAGGVYAPQLCEEHREMVVRTLQEMIRNSRDSIAKAERRLAELLDDDLLDTIALKRAI